MCWDNLTQRVGKFVAQELQRKCDQHFAIIPPLDICADCSLAILMYIYIFCCLENRANLVGGHQARRRCWAGTEQMINVSMTEAGMRKLDGVDRCLDLRVYLDRLAGVACTAASPEVLC